MSITNSHGTTITIDSLHIVWIKVPGSQQLTLISLQAVPVMNSTDSDSPSDIPSEKSWKSGANLDIPDATTEPLDIQFSGNLAPGDYSINVVVLGLGCQVQDSITIP
jgi:hypothetical protein